MPRPLLFSQLTRYFNSDFVFLSATRNRQIHHLKTSYDIACQWKVDFYKRCAEMDPAYTHHLEEVKIDFGIPKFHLPAHGPKCHTLYSLNFKQGWARTDGEGIERLWASTNPVATMTREMGPGQRHDFLDDLWGASNFRKRVNLGEFSKPGRSHYTLTIQTQVLLYQRN
jgi:hypothetical protein